MIAYKNAHNDFFIFVPWILPFSWISVYVSIFFPIFTRGAGFGAGNFDVKMTSPGDWLCEACRLACGFPGHGLKMRIEAGKIWNMSI